MVPDVLVVLEHVTQTLNRLGISYLIGGSVASSALGAYRYTNDIDVVVDLATEAIDALASALIAEYYVDVDTIRDAVQHRSSFSLLHLETMMKVDVFIKPIGVWTDTSWARRRLQVLDTPGGSIEIYVRSPEDMVLQKLRWYQLGREVSDRQWSDVIRMLEVQSAVLDYDYLEEWAKDLKVADLLYRSYQDAGIGNR